MKGNRFPFKSTEYFVNPVNFKTFALSYQQTTGSWQRKTNQSQMLFNSLEFPVFLGLILLLFQVFRKSGDRQILLLFSSLFFYGYWKWSYLVLLIVSSSIDYWAAIQIGKHAENRQKRFFLFCSIAGNLSILLYFKYGTFLGHTFFFKSGPLPDWLDVVLPVGISFYTFQAIGYVIDVYRNRLPAEKSYVSFLLFITFFPQLVAGPIERAPHLLNQLKKFNANAPVLWLPGIWLVIRGFAKKLLLADRLGVYVDAAFNNPSATTLPQVITSTVFFGFQIYCDFSGYSDIARGIASFFGVDLMKNFDLPYLAKSLSEFWRRWHISLSGWFRDYVYFPLGGSKNGTFSTVINLLVVFGLSGLWHGANWTFLLWGLWHGAGLIGERFLTQSTNRSSTSASGNSNRLIQGFTLFWVFTGWFFFRVNSIDDLSHLLLHSEWSFRNFNLFHSASELTLSVAGILILLILEIKVSSQRFKIYHQNFWTQSSAILIVIAFLIWFGHFKGQDFIYFQF